MRLRIVNYTSRVGQFVTRLRHTFLREQEFGLSGQPEVNALVDGIEVSFRQFKILLCRNHGSLSSVQRIKRRFCIEDHLLNGSIEPEIRRNEAAPRLIRARLAAAEIQKRPVHFDNRI